MHAVTELAVACVSELAANAAQHVDWGRVRWGQRVIWLSVELFGPLLVVEVRDPDGTLPRVGKAIDWASFDQAAADVSLLPESGMGLRTVVDRVEQVGGAFGSVRLPGGGKSVFFVVP